MENRRGSGIFLGVVSVATLVVAIIGATFAYFSASVTADNTVDLTAYEFDAKIELNRVFPVASDADKKLIPMVPTTTVANAPEGSNTNLLYAMNAADSKCVDPRGYLVCAVYEVTITNNGSAPITLSGTLTGLTNRHANLVGGELPAEPETYNKFVNLTYQPLTNSGSSYALTGSTQTMPDENATITLEGMTVPAYDAEDEDANKVSKYFVVYLNDPVDEGGETDEQNTEMGVVYQANVTYTDSTSGSKLTGTFTVQG